MSRWIPSGREQALVDAINADPEFRLAARFWNGSFRFTMGDDGSYLFRVRDGRIDGVECWPTPFDAFDFEVAGPAPGWRELFAPMPRPFYQDVASALFREGFTLGGDVESFFAYHAALRRIVAVARRTAADAGGR